MSDTTLELSAHLCAFCFKAYRRHDLLLRHQRRCKGPKKPSTRRKVCNACAEAKARCNTETPCVRCLRRGVPCEYMNQPPGLQDTNETPELTDTLVGRHLSHMEAAGFNAQDLPWNPASMTQGATTDLSVHIDPSLPLWDFPLSALGSPSNIGGLYDTVLDNQQSQPLFRTLLQELKKYPKLLLRHDFESPFAHYSLFDNDVPDMATLEKSAMAICCGSALATTDASHFARHMMNLERERLIEWYPTYGCMHQWDALHAMLVYEILELTISSTHAKDSWKKRAQSKGLRAPFLAKMTRAFLQSHSNADSNLSRPNIGDKSFTEWGVSETARRTIFLSNIVHFFSNRDVETGESSLYYEPLDDDFILNLPLPSTSPPWLARSDKEWKATMEYQLSGAFSVENREISTIGIAPSHLTLKAILANFSKEELQSWAIHQGVGFEGSDALRNLIILCALEQYG